MWTEGKWDEQKLIDMNIPFELREKIMKVSILQVNDMLYWTSSKDGNFSTKCAWNYIREKKKRSCLYKPLTCGYLRANVRILGLRLYNKWIPTEARLRAKEIQLASACQCFKKHETTQHLFVECQESRKM